MRVPDLSPALSRALDGAVGFAVRSGAVEIEPRHLLLALLEDDEGRAATLISRAGGDLERIRQSLHPHDSLPGSIGEQQYPLRGKHLEQVLFQAARIAAERSAERTVTSDEVLSAILECEPDLRRVLEDAGANLTQLEPDLGPSQLPPVPLDEPLHSVETTATVDAHRVIDASANRAREALRVVEDYCRFVLDDGLLTGELKRLRHELTESLAVFPDAHLLQARETLRDVGTGISTSSEHSRHSLTAVVQANFKRLQEALRSLEEFGKFLGPELGRVLEALRYRTYTLERAIVLGTSARQRLVDARLYLLLTRSQCLGSLEWTIEEAAAGGVDIVQLREKKLPDGELLALAGKVQRWSRKAGVLFVLNDRPDIARLVEADGVHLGQDDLPVKEARRILGPDALLGVSTREIAHVRQAVLDGASYIGVGPAFPSQTKSFNQFPGLELIGKVAVETTLPAFLIGGVGPKTIDTAIKAGAKRVAVGLAIAQAEEPRAVAAGLRQALGPMI